MIKWSVFRLISVEPTLFLYYIAASMASIAETNLHLQKARSQVLLEELEGYDAEEQRTVTLINSWKSVFEYALPAVIILLGGAWSDTHGKRRKPLMIFPIGGEIASLFFVCESVFFWWSAETTAFVSALCRGLSGGRTCFSFAAITYIGDTTLPEQRTFRMSVITALIFISTPLGYAVGGVMRQFCGFYVTFNICIVLNLLALVLALFLVKECSDEKPVEKSCGCQELSNICRTVFKPRERYRRAIFLLMVVVSPLFGACLAGEYSVLYLFIRHKFHWDEATSGIYLAYRMSITFFGTLLSVGVLSKLLHFSDSVIGLLAASLQILSSLGNAFSRHSWQMFFFPLVDLMHGSIFAVSHSIVSKTVEPSELGKVNSVLSAVDSFVPLVVLPLYNMTYSWTLDTRWPGTFFFLSAVIAFFCWTIFLTVTLLYKKDRTKVHVVVG